MWAEGFCLLHKRMIHTNHGELLRIFDTYCRVWKAGGQATLTTSTEGGLLKANLDIQLGWPSAACPGAPPPHLCESHSQAGSANVDITSYVDITSGKRKYRRGRISGRRQQWVLGGVVRETGEIFLEFCPNNKVIRWVLFIGMVSQKNCGKVWWFAKPPSLKYHYRIFFTISHNIFRPFLPIITYKKLNFCK